MNSKRDNERPMTATYPRVFVGTNTKHNKAIAMIFKNRLFPFKIILLLILRHEDTKVKLSGKEIEIGAGPVIINNSMDSLMLNPACLTFILPDDLFLFINPSLDLLTHLWYWFKYERMAGI